MPTTMTSTFGAALANTRAEPGLELTRHALADSELLMLSGESFFVATHALWAGELDPPEPEHGTLIAVPNRSVLFAHPIRDRAAVRMLTPMLELARRFAAAGGPGAINTNLYWLRGDGQLDKINLEETEHTIVIAPASDFAQLLDGCDYLSRRMPAWTDRNRDRVRLRAPVRARRRRPLERHAPHGWICGCRTWASSACRCAIEGYSGQARAGPRGLGSRSRVLAAGGVGLARVRVRWHGAVRVGIANGAYRARWSARRERRVPLPALAGAARGAAGGAQAPGRARPASSGTSRRCCTTRASRRSAPCGHARAR